MQILEKLGLRKKVTTADDVQFILDNRAVPNSFDIEDFQHLQASRLAVALLGTSFATDPKYLDFIEKKGAQMAKAEKDKVFSIAILTMILTGIVFGGGYNISNTQIDEIDTDAVNDAWEAYFDTLG